MQYLRICKVIKVGDSLAVVIPRSVRDALFIQRGDQLAWCLYGDSEVFFRKLDAAELQQLKPKIINE